MISFKYFSNDDLVFESDDTTATMTLLNDILMSKKVISERMPWLKYTNRLVFTFRDSSEKTFTMDEFDIDSSALYSNNYYVYLPSFSVADRVVEIFRINVRSYPAFRKWLKVTSRDLELVNGSDRDMVVYYNIKYPDTSFANSVLSGPCPAYDYAFVTPELKLREDRTIEGITVFLVDQGRLDSCNTALPPCEEDVAIIKKWILTMEDVEKVEGKLLYWPSK